MAAYSGGAEDYENEKDPNGLRGKIKLPTEEEQFDVGGVTLAEHPIMMGRSFNDRPSKLGMKIKKSQNGIKDWKSRRHVFIGNLVGPACVEERLGVARACFPPYKRDSPHVLCMSCVPRCSCD